MTERSTADRRNDRHRAAYEKEYARLKNCKDEAFRVRWANQVANSIALQGAVHGPNGGDGWAAGPFAAEDYLSDSDSKRANGMGVPW